MPLTTGISIIVRHRYVSEAYSSREKNSVDKSRQAIADCFGGANLNSNTQQSHSCTFQAHTNSHKRRAQRAPVINDRITMFG